MHQLPARFQTSAACLLSWQLLFMHVSAAWFFATAAAYKIDDETQISPLILGSSCKRVIYACV